MGLGRLAKAVVTGAILAVVMSAAPGSASMLGASTPKVGATIRFTHGKITVHSYEQPAGIPTSTFSKPSAGHEFGAVEVEGCNSTSQTLDLNPYQFQLEMPDHSRLQPTVASRVPALHDTPLASKDCVRGWVTFEVPSGILPSFVRFQSGSTLGGNATLARWRVTKDTTIATTTTLPPGQITKAKYDQIQTGMTYDQVVAIIGSQGIVQFQSGTFSSYQWKAGDSASASISFQNAAVSSKSQFGLS
jgi:hypothetical protein